MTVYIRPNGDDKNDGSEKKPRSNHPSAQSQSQIGLRTTRSTCSRPIGRGWNRALDAEEDQFPQGGG